MKNSKPVRCKDFNVVFRSLSEAARELNLNPGGISKVCNGKKESFCGLHFEFVIEEDE